MTIDNTASKQFLFAIMLNITGSMYFFENIDQGYGIVIALYICVMIYITLAVYCPDKKTAQCSERLSLILLCLILTSSLPWFFLRDSSRLPGHYTTVFFICSLQIFQENATLEDLGLRQNILVIVAFLGILLMISELYGFYYFRDLLTMIIFKGTAEELLYRALIQKSLKDVAGSTWSIIMTSMLFTVTHITWLSMAEMVFVYSIGFSLGMLYEKSDNLLGPIFIHGLCTSIMGL